MIAEFAPTDPAGLAWTFNLLEAALWFAVGMVVLGRTFFSGKPSRHAAILAAAFFLFGLSDVIEMQTGAWYKPISLFFFKAACVIVFLFYLVRHLRARRSEIAKKHE